MELFFLKRETSLLNVNDFKGLSEVSRSNEIGDHLLIFLHSRLIIFLMLVNTGFLKLRDRNKVREVYGLFLYLVDCTIFLNLLATLKRTGLD